MFPIIPLIVPAIEFTIGWIWTIVQCPWIEALL